MRSNDEHNRKLTHANEQPPSDADARREDARLRQVLAAYGQPDRLEPPPAIAARVLASLPDLPPTEAAAAQRRRMRRMVVLRVAVLAVVLMLLALGSWGVFIDSAGLVQLFGDTAGGIGYVLLTLVLLAKPLVLALVGPGMAVLAAVMLVFVLLAWVWWLLVRQAPLVQPTGAGL
jgi:hypothetical protein